MLATLPVPEAPAGRAGMAWLRASVSRFANGDPYRRRRALAKAELARLDPERLAVEAARLAATAVAEAGAELDAMSLARRVPVQVLCEALAGVTVDAALVEAAEAVAAAYPPGSASGPAEDAALAHLVAVFGAGEEGAARIALLAQACDATAALIGNALLGEEGVPVRLTRRVGPAGEPVVLDLEASGLPYGAGPRACPGEAHAVAIAAAVVAAVLAGAEVVEDAPACERSPNLRVPARVRVSRR